MTVLQQLNKHVFKKKIDKKSDREKKYKKICMHQANTWFLQEHYKLYTEVITNLLMLQVFLISNNGASK